MIGRRNAWIVFALVIALVASGLVLGVGSTSFAQKKSSKAQKPDPSYCDSYARSYADRNTNGAGDVVGGALGGAAGGALLGGIIGGGKGAGKGAAIGAGVGAVGGGISASQKWNDNYRWAYDSCMNGGR